MSVRIIVDSTADLPQHLKGKLETVPLTIHFGDQEYIDGVTISNKEFYEKLVSDPNLPSTSQAIPSDFEGVFRKVVEAGDTAVVITIASKLSGTYQSAIIAAEDFEGKIFVVDSQNVAITAGILAEYACELVREGKTASQIAEILTQIREKLCLVAVVDTLEYLKRGGRVSKTVAFAGGLLSIKPVIGVFDGEIQMLSKARGNRQANQQLLKEIEATGGVDYEKPVLLGYTGTEDTLLQKFMEETADFWADHPGQLRSTIVGSVVGIHAGPGAVAVAYFKK